MKRVILVCGMACCVMGSVFGRSNALDIGEQRRFTNYLQRKAFFQSFAAEERLIAHYKPVDLFAPEEEQTQAAIWNIAIRAKFLSEELFKDGFSLKDGKDIIVGCNQALALKAYAFYRDRGAPDKALYVLANGIFGEEEEGQAPEPINPELYHTLIDALMNGELENGAPCTWAVQIAMALIYEFAEFGDVTSMDYVASTLWEKGDKEYAAKWEGRIKAKAQEGDIDAIRALIMAYLRGLYCEPDAEEAKKWALEAQKLGDAGAVEFVMQALEEMAGELIQTTHVEEIPNGDDSAR